MKREREREELNSNLSSRNVGKDSLRSLSFSSPSITSSRAIKRFHPFLTFSLSFFFCFSVEKNYPIVQSSISSPRSIFRNETFPWCNLKGNTKDDSFLLFRCFYLFAFLSRPQLRLFILFRHRKRWNFSRGIVVPFFSLFSSFHPVLSRKSGFAPRAFAFHWHATKIWFAAAGKSGLRIEITIKVSLAG